MKNKSVFVIFFIAVSILFTNAILVLSNYNSIPEQIIGHLDITGRISFHSKYNLIYALLINLIFLIIVFIVILKPKIANYPVSINENNRESLYKKMQYFLSIIAVLTSITFAFFSFKAINITRYFPYFLLTILAVPSLSFIFFFKKSK